MKKNNAEILNKVFGEEVLLCQKINTMSIFSDLEYSLYKLNKENKWNDIQYCIIKKSNIKSYYYIQNAYCIENPFNPKSWQQNKFLFEKEEEREITIVDKVAFENRISIFLEKEGISFKDFMNQSFVQKSLKEPLIDILKELNDTSNTKEINYFENDRVQILVDAPISYLNEKINYGYTYKTIDFPSEIILITAMNNLLNESKTEKINMFLKNGNCFCVNKRNLDNLKFFDLMEYSHDTMNRMLYCNREVYFKLGELNEEKMNLIEEEFNLNHSIKRLGKKYKETLSWLYGQNFNWNMSPYNYSYEISSSFTFPVHLFNEEKELFFIFKGFESEGCRAFYLEEIYGDFEKNKINDLFDIIRYVPISLFPSEGRCIYKNIVFITKEEAKEIEMMEGLEI